ncbi:hypothetical protein Golomagni_07039 [Golovinomyces magnicellulatus]|nr:hypothetical protein Golomagni_07039 [Golovinomyces magnicellulatus]
MSVSIGSSGQWSSLLSSTDVVVADCKFSTTVHSHPSCQEIWPSRPLVCIKPVLTKMMTVYADWCGPCKVIGPHFEKLAQEHAKPKKMAFAKINVDNQNDIAQQYGVSAMPTFKVFHKGACIDTIKGANPAALAAAITKAKQLVGSGGGQTFQSRGRTLGGQQSTRINFNLNAFINGLVSFLGLYVTSFFTLNALRAARESPFNPERRPERPQPSSSGTTGSSTAKPAAKQSNFRTLADL